MTVERPEFRISDAEREEAIEALGEHMRDGRLDIDEYGDRTARVTAAKTRGELITLFSDLPEPRPEMLREQLPAPPQRERPERRRGHEPRRQHSGRRTLGAVPIAAIAIIGVLVLSKGAGMMFLLPIAVLVFAVIACGNLFGPGRG
ncbi:DUF1707 SHOCT-like domain-containing protein [Haloechinothrix halophila]|uniref:DUF1707 SHOCT-like domain-containing protein n=1 Tax=Haloechinothrix halophila TaxID=1069073 RepID=UPI0004111168|nr:DUF1707 domain-containing protein [Haloechinothrix halophila]